MSDGGSIPLGVFGVVVHTVHYVLLYGGLVVLALLLTHSRPRSGRSRSGSGAGSPRAVPTEHERRVARLREAAVHGRLAVLPPGPASASAVRPPSVLAPPAPAPDAAATTWLPVAVVGSVAAAGVHAAASPAHVAEGVLVGGFFVLATAAQLGWALAVLLSGATRTLLACAAVGNAGVVAVWLLSRTTGVPGAGLPSEPVGAWDLAATGWELAVVLGVSLVLTSHRFAPPAARLLDIVRWSSAAQAWLAGSVTLLLVLTVTGTSG